MYIMTRNTLVIQATLYILYRDELPSYALLPYVFFLTYI